MSAGNPFDCAICVASWVELWCGLKPTTVCDGLQPELIFRSMLDIVCNQPIIVTLSSGPGCLGEGAKLCARTCSCSPELEADQ